MRVKRIRIKSVDQGFRDFVKTYKRASRRVLAKRRKVTFFASVQAARRVLTESRIQLLKTIKQKRPSSLYELAQLTQRDFKNVAQDIGFLSELGLVELGPPRGIRSQRKPTLVSDHISVELSI